MYLIQYTMYWSTDEVIDSRFSLDEEGQEHTADLY